VLEAPKDMFISGTWAKGQMQQMEKDDDEDEAVYSFLVTLGDTRCERFCLSTDREGTYRIYPYANNGSVRTRVYGPDEVGRGRNWLIDGRNAKVPAGSVYKVVFRWGKPMSVAWELMEARCTDAELQVRRDKQRYQVQGSFTSWSMRELTRMPNEPNTYQFSVKVGVTGREYFQFLADGDASCMIYPSRTMEKMASSHITSLPVRGPDELGHGKHFRVSGSPGDMIKLRLRIIDAHINVEVWSDTQGSMVWQSQDGPARHDYFIQGTFSEWQPIPLLADPENCNIYKYRGVTGINAKEFFNILIDEDTKCLMYPEAAGSAPGTSIVRGPDDKKADSMWELNCWMQGVPFEVTLDLEAVDKRKKVTVSWLAPLIDYDTMRAVVAQSLSS